MMVAGLVISLAAPAFAATSVSDMFPGLNPVLEYDVANWDGIGAIPNTGVRNHGGPFGSQVAGAIFDNVAISEEEAGAPVYVGDDGRPYLRFQQYGYVTCNDSPATHENAFRLDVGYTLVGYYRFTEDFYAKEGGAIGMAHKGGWENSLLHIGWWGQGRDSITNVTNNSTLLKDDLSNDLPENEWFQLVKTFTPIMSADATAIESYQVDYYVNGHHVLTNGFDAEENDTFQWLWAGVGDIGVCRQGPLGIDPKHQMMGLDYGYFAAYDRPLSAEEVALSYQYLIIPEPATMTLLALGGLAMLRRRR